MGAEAAVERLEFRDPERARALTRRLALLCEEIAKPVSVMHVCGTHEQSIARFGLRSLLPKALTVLMGPGCPVCVTDMPEVDEAVALARQGIVIATFGDMFRVPGSVHSLAEAKAAGADVRVVYNPFEALKIAQETAKEVVFFATGFETTAVATAALVLAHPPRNLSVLSAHKYIPPVMEIVAEMPQTHVQGFLAAGHAATITGWRIFERFVARHHIPVVTAGFEPLDILAALSELLRLIRDREERVVNAYPRCVTAEGNREAQKLLWEVFATEGGNWRGIAHVPNGNLRLRPKYSSVDARCRFDIASSDLADEAPPRLAQECICGNIMAGIAGPADCRLFGKECTPQNPVGACMVSSEGTCKIWHEYGGHVIVNE
ncbi:MAG TPA: hydrogenase formation protein HypD [Candidatus Acidoferrales bacterium]|nr:hydrogenase formation protein HypD [Candidatus Acidoferrales bacterium]